MTNSIREIRDADCVLVIGSNTGESHPVISYEVVRAVKRGATLIVIDPRRISLTRHAALHLRPKPGTDHALYLGMLHTIVANGWHDRTFITERTEGFEALVESLRSWTPEAASAACGVPAEQIVEAARCYALGLRRQASTNGAIPPSRGASSILYGMGITERANGTELVKTMANLAMITGQIGRPSTGVNPLRGQNNVQGGCDMGSLPNVYPGYQKVEDAEERALRALDFLVVQEIFPTETAQLAHVVLPAASFAEKNGTFVNTERRFQLVRPFLPPPGEARPDWQIIGEVGRRLGRRLRRPVRWEYASAAEVMREVALLCPTFRGISHERLARGGIQWPCPSPDHPGTPFLHKGQFVRGKGKFHVTAPAPPFEPTDAEYPLALSTGRILYHYNGGAMSRRAAPLAWREARAYAEIHPEDAARAGVRDGQTCQITTRRGQIRVQARVGDIVSPGMIYVPFHFRESASNVLTHAESLDAWAKTPEYKFAAGRLEKGRPERGGGEKTAD